MGSAAPRLAFVGPLDAEVRSGFLIAAAFAVLAQWGGPWASVALHSATTGLLYVFLASLSGRTRGAPLIAAVLFGAAGFAPRWFFMGDARTAVPAGTALGLLSGVLLIQSPRRRGLLVPALAAYAASVLWTREAVAVPLVVALGVVAYHGLPPARLFTKRHVLRFAPFGLVLVAVIAIVVARAGGLRGGLDCGATYVSSHAVASTSWTLLPAPLGRALADAAHTPTGIIVSGALLLAALVEGASRLSRNPRTAFAAASWALVAVAPVAVLALVGGDAPTFGYLAPAFALLVVAEGLEHLFFAFGGVVAMPLLAALVGAFIAQSRLLVPAQ